jgi:hypothetical protein
MAKLFTDLDAFTEEGEEVQRRILREAVEAINDGNMSTGKQSVNFSYGA